MIYEALDAKGRLQMAKNGLEEVERKHWLLVMNGRLETNPAAIKNILQQQDELAAKIATLKTIIKECEKECEAVVIKEALKVSTESGDGPA